MKNLITLCLAVILILSFGGQAMPFFEEGHLIRVVYDRGGTYEVVTDLGKWDITSPYTGNHVLKSNAFNRIQLGVSGWDTVYVAYFMRFIAGGVVRAWTSGPAEGQVGKGNGGNALLSAIGTIAGANMQTGLAQNVNYQSLSSSFSSLFGTRGNFGGFLATNDGEASLIELDTKGFVEQSLYYYDSPINARNTYNGLAVFNIRTHADGTTEIMAVPPIPAQRYLLSVSKVGNGTVTSDDGLIACGSRCSHRYPQGAAVHLTALPDAGAIFTGWSGDCAGTGNCVLDMNSDRSATATFSPQGVTVAPISPDDGVTIDVSSLYNPILFSWSCGEAFKKIEIQFSADNFVSIPVKLKKKGCITEAYIPSGSWKKILKLPGSEGGIVSWRVVGTRADGGAVRSAIRTFTVKGPEAAGSPRIEHVSRTLQPPPVLAWVNNNNVKFKAWFGNNADFATAGVKRKVLTFTIKDPLQNNGCFMKLLTAGQWKAIRRVVGDAAGQTVYWHIESWDALKRYSKSEVMSFIISE